MVNELHNFNTRNSKLSIVLLYVKSAGLKSFRYAASRAWNSLPFSIKSLTEKNAFKVAAKRALQSRLVVADIDSYVYY